MKHQRQRTKPNNPACYLYHYLLDGISYRNTAAKALCEIVHISHRIYQCGNGYKNTGPNKISIKRKKIDGYIVEETQIKIGPNTHGCDGLQ